MDSPRRLIAACALLLAAIQSFTLRAEDAEAEVVRLKAAIQSHELARDEMRRENTRYAEELVRLRGVLVKQSAGETKSRDQDRRQIEELAAELKAVKALLTTVAKDVEKIRDRK